jgi:hypothetical protein
MANLLIGQPQLLLRIGVALITAGVLGGCYRPPSPPTPKKECRSGTPPTAGQLDTCLAGLTFDTAYEAGDMQPLTFVGKGPGQPCPGDSTRSCSYGPMAKIEPVIGAQKYSTEALREGRFIARIVVDTSERKSYKKYNLEPGGTTYWWVKTNAAGTGGSSYFLTRTMDGRFRQSEARPLVREPYDEGRGTGYDKARDQRAMMRWIWDLNDETAKGQCGSASCK